MSQHIPLFGDTLKNQIEKVQCIVMLIVASVSNSENEKQPRRPTSDKWIRKQWYIY